MSVATLIQTDNLGGCPFPFFDETPRTYKIYNDGRHLIATECRRSGRKPKDLPERRRKSDDCTDEQKNTVFRRFMRDKKRENDHRIYTPAAEKIDDGFKTRVKNQH